MLDKYMLQIFADIFGWIYFLCWTASFYPQTIVNFRIKSVAGYSLDFVALNLLGTFGYTVFTSTLYWNEAVRQEYINFERTKQRDVPVVANDVAYAIHGLLLTIIHVVQCIIYDRGSQKVSHIAKLLVTIGTLALIGAWIACQLGVLQWLWLVNVAGYVKLSCSFIKVSSQFWYSLLH